MNEDKLTVHIAISLLNSCNNQNHCLKKYVGFQDNEAQFLDWSAPISLATDFPYCDN